MDFPPETADYVQQIVDRNERVKTQLKALYNAYKKQEEVLKNRSEDLKRLRVYLKKAISRIRFVEDIPGKRIPFFLCFEIEVPGPDKPSFSLINQKLSAVKTVPTDGLFVATSYMAAFKLKTYSLGFVGASTEIPAAGVEVISPFTGRFRPISSTADPMNGAYIGPGVGASFIARTTAVVPDGGAYFTRGFRPGTIDFLWEVADEGSSRIHQNVPLLMPSRYLYSEFDRPLYLPTSDVYERGSAIRASIILTRNLDIVEFTTQPYQTTDGIWTEASWIQDVSGNQAVKNRSRLGLGGTLTFVMAGYKILQSQSPAV